MPVDIPGIDALAKTSPTLAALVLVVGLALLLFWRIWRSNSQMVAMWFEKHERAEKEQFAFVAANTVAVKQLAEATVTNTVATNQLAGVILDHLGARTGEHVPLPPLPSENGPPCAAAKK